MATHLVPTTFLGLPGEIRNQIYCLLLVLPDTTSKEIFHVELPLVYPQILSVCKPIHEESKQILYGRNLFHAHAELLTGLPRLRIDYDTVKSVEMISLIRRYRIRVRLDCDPNFSAKQAEDSFSGMEELFLQAFQAQFGGSDFSVLRLFEGVRGVKRVTISGSINAFPEYAKWLQARMMAPVGCDVGTFDPSGLERAEYACLCVEVKCFSANSNIAMSPRMLLGLCLFEICYLKVFSICLGCRLT